MMQIVKRNYLCSCANTGCRNDQVSTQVVMEGWSRKTISEGTSCQHGYKDRGKLAGETKNIQEFLIPVSLASCL